jgi:hypothetical protein
MNVFDELADLQWTTVVTQCHAVASQTSLEKCQCPSAQALG